MAPINNKNKAPMSDDRHIGHEAIGQLAVAKQQLGEILPPQASPILRAFQKLEIALHYAAIEGHARSAWNATSEALRALDRIEKKNELPSAVRVALAHAIAGIHNAFDTIETAERKRRAPFLDNHSKSDHLGRTL